ncbi:hypothetical protein L2E82_51426 [Cichorium intybus]|nr:hypothetical protein L2E82_51426 [Cichorium intybus]
MDRNILLRTNKLSSQIGKYNGLTSATLLYSRFCTFKFVAILGLVYFNSASELGFHLDKLNRLSPISGGLFEITIRTAFMVSPTTDGSSDDLVPSTSPNDDLEDQDQVVIHFQDMHEVVIRDLMEDQFPNLDGLRYDYKQYQLFAPTGAIPFSTPESKAWKEKINRLYLLLTVKESAMDVPSNLEARRRISFFSNSLFMNMPSAPKVRNMLSFL